MAFFHRSACVHQSFNYLRKIVIDRGTIVDWEDMIATFVTHFILN